MAPAATWRGVYYRGEKIGFTVSQTVPTDDGFDLQRTAACRWRCSARRPPRRIRTTAHVDQASRCTPSSSRSIRAPARSQSRGRIDGRRLSLDVKTPSGTPHATSASSTKPPALSQNMSRRLANGGLKTGARYQWTVFDPATLRNSRGQRRGRPARAGARRRRGAAAGLPRRDGVRRPEDLVVDHRHRRGRARGEPARTDYRARVGRQRASAMAVSRRMQVDLLQAAAVAPRMTTPIAEPRDVRLMRIRLGGADLSAADLDGGAQRFAGRRPRAARSAGPRSRRAADPDAVALSRGRGVHRERRAGDHRGGEEGGAGRQRHARARRAADALRQRAARQEADRQPAVGARSAAHQSRRLQRAHRALRRDGARARHSGADRRRPGLHPRRVLLPRVARGVHRGRAAGSGRQGCGCRSIRRSTSFPPTPRTCGSRAAGSTSRR